MRELIRTTDRILVSAILACLADHDIEALPFDENVNALWSAVFPIRIVVPDEDFDRAQDAIADLKQAAGG